MQQIIVHKGFVVNFLKCFWKPLECVSSVVINKPDWLSHSICCFFLLLSSLPILYFDVSH